MPHPVIIIGAGLTGLATAFHLKHDYRLLEREREVGGLARSVRRGPKNAFTFDLAGHWLHLAKPEVREWVARLLQSDAGGTVAVERRAAIATHGVRVPYPFQAHTHGLPTEVVADCLLGYFRAREVTAALGAASPKSFDEFIRTRLGDGIARHFMVPYNTKLWTVPPSALAADWCRRFVPLPTPEEVVWGALCPGGLGHALGYNAQFVYPAHGGIAQLPQAIALGLRRPAELGVEVVSVDWRARQLHLNTGEVVDYRVLLSTMPLSDLASRLREPPEVVRREAAKLRSVSVSFWDIGVAGGAAADEPHWLYVPGDDVPFYRVGSPSAVAGYLAPPGHRSYSAEASHPRGTAAPVSDGAIVDGLRRVALLRAGEEPLFCQRSTIDCAYVLMDDAYGEARRELLAWLEGNDILSIGRYGAWTYDAMEGALAAGVAAAQAATRALERSAEAAGSGSARDH